MKTIVAAIDFSDVTSNVLEQAVKLAKIFDATLHLLHTVDPGPNYALYGFSPAEFPVNPMNDKLKAASDSRLLELAESTGLLPGKVVTATVLSLPVDGILEYAKERFADLIVLGAHGHGFFSAVLIGSVAQGVVRRAELPTLVVPSKG